MSELFDGLPDNLRLLVTGAIDAEMFSDADDAVQTALREYFDGDDTVRNTAVMQLYEANHISLGKAARLAEVSRQEMIQLLRNSNIEIQLGPGSMEEAEAEIDLARDID
jgi:predicted HTH domain antitoxin